MSQNSPLQSIGNSLAQGYYDTGLAMPSFMPWIVVQKGWMNRLTYLSSMLGPTQYVQNGLVNQYYTQYKNVNITSTAVSLTNNNTQATITLASGSEDLFRTSEIITDSTTKTQAKVVFHNSSQIIVTWASSSDITATGFTASDFIAGHIIVGGSLSSNMNTGLVAENLNSIPYKNTFAMQNFFDSQTLTLEDFIDKKYTVTRGVDNEQYLAHTKVEEMFKRYLNNMEKTFTSSTGRIVDPTGVVKENFTMGVTEQIKSYGGGYQPIYNTVSEQDLKDAITYLRDVAGKGVQVYVAPGSAFMGAVQTFLSNKYITYAGTTNTFGGNEVKGLNLKKYEWLDIELLFDTDFNNFNNNTWYPNAAADGTPNAQRGSALLFNTEDVETEQGMIPFISQYSWGKAGMENRFGELTVIKDGAIDGNGNAIANPISPKKSVTWHVEANAAAVLNDPTKHVYIERN